MNKGELLAIWGRQEWGGVMSSFDSANLIADKGMVEDVSFGSPRQITIIEEEVWSEVMKKLGSDLPPETRRANLLIRGINLTESRDRILKIGDCRIQIMGETTPCMSMDKKLPGLKNALQPNWNGGAFGKVLDGGEISIGDSVTWKDPNIER